MTLEAYVAHTSQRQSVVWIEGVPWRMARRILEPLVMPHTMRPVDRTKVREAMRKTGAWVARWNDTWDTAPCEWWWVCCDNTHYDMARLSRGSRQDIRIGIRRCETRQIEGAFLAEHGYAIHRDAHKQYGVDIVATTPEQFAESVLAADASGCYEFWGTFVKGALAAYALCIVCQEAVNLSTVKSDPQRLKANPNNALLYLLTRHYLRDRGMKYITDGVRGVYHVTRFQDFVEKLGYRRIYCPLRLELSLPTRLAVASGADRWGRALRLDRLAPGAFEKLAAVVRLVKIADACRRLEAATPAAAATPAGAGPASSQPAGET